MFNVINMATGELVLARVHPKVYPDGKSANEAAKALTESTGLKHQVRPVAKAASVDWRARENARFTNGSYKALLPSLQTYAKADHFAHVSLDRPEVVAFTVDDAKGQRDVQTRRTVAAYLEAFAPEVSPELRLVLQAEHVKHFSTLDLKFGLTEDDFERVYTNFDDSENGVSDSCMRYKTCSFDSPIHPVRVYAAGDLQVAYLTNEYGKTTARALCWPEKLVYSRVYGGTDAGKLHTLLKANGYVKSFGYYSSSQHPDVSSKSLSGARLLKVRHNGAYVTPYNDEFSGMDDCGDYFKLDGSDCSCQETNGLTCGTEDQYEYSCDHCTDGCDDVTEVHYNASRPGRTHLLCNHCVENLTFSCYGTHEAFASSEFMEVEVDGHYYESNYANDHFDTCEHTGELTSEDTQTVIVDRSGATQTWCQSSCYDAAFKSVADGLWYTDGLNNGDDLPVEINVPCPLTASLPFA